MVVSAALLIRERGAHATAISDVLEHSGAPRGSAYHYFPGGRTQLLCEAVDYAGEHVAGIITEAAGSHGLLDTLIEKYRQQLLDSDFRAGCPVVAVAVEAGEDRERMASVTERAAAVFDHWTDLIAQRFIADGLPTDQANELAVLATSAIEGAILLARVRRDLTPLDVVHRQLRNCVSGRERIPAMTAEWQPTACILCECNCGIVVQVEGRTLARIRGDKEHPGTQGYTCNKALRLDHYQNNRARLTSPMRRRADGTYEEIDWDTAIIEIAEGFKHIRDTYGGDKIFYYGGGGQGNHLGGAYSGAFLKALGSRYRSNALAQEKTGEAWVDAHLYGGHTRGEFEHAEVSVFVGKNPWMSQSFPRARVVLNEIAKDPARSMIVIDPVLTDTAKMADFHLRVRPGTDAWCLAALAAVLVQESLCDEAFLAEHVHGVDAVREALREVPIADYAQHCGVDEELLRAAARRIGTAGSVVGVRRPRHSAGTQQHPVLLSEQAAVDSHRQLREKGRPAPAFVVRPAVQHGLRSHAGHRRPDNRGVDAGQRGARGDPDRPPGPVPGDDRRKRQSRSLACRLDRLPKGVQVTGTDGGRRRRDDRNGQTRPLRAARGIPVRKAGSHVLQFRVPDNSFQLRRPLLEPLPGTLPEPEIWARLVRALGVVDDADLRPLREAAQHGRQAYTEAFLAAVATNPTVAKLLPYVLYETLGPTLPDGMAGRQRCGGWPKRPR